MKKLTIKERRKERAKFKTKFLPDNKYILVINKSNCHMQCQVLKDGKTIHHGTTLKLQGSGIEKAAKLGKIMHEKITKNKINVKDIVFRITRKFHGRIKSLIEQITKVNV